LATLAKGLIGFLLPGAVMFLWLLLFNEWRRLRPFYLFSGLMVFAAVALPWHLLVAHRNPEWAWFYFVHEHWLRFTTKTHGRYQPWWFFLPVIFLGLFPWSGFLWPALRSTVPREWTRRSEYTDKAFLLVWAAFILLFFSVSDSKLVPYVLPVFPPLAVILGGYLGPRMRTPSAPGLGAGFLGFSVVAGLLGAALIAVFLKPKLLGAVANVQELSHFAMLAGVFLLGGALGVYLLLRSENTKVALRLMLGTTAAFATVLVIASPAIARASTKDLARTLEQQIKPGDVVLCYHDYFHDFSYYAQRTVGTVKYEGELELALDPSAAAKGLHINEERFRELWNGPQRVFLVLRRSEMPVLAAQPGFHARILAEARNHLLLINQH
jgi:4-amino-4-deoxy-L-arabinose transferase-like glycosyltransferase